MTPWTYLAPCLTRPRRSLGFLSKPKRPKKLSVQFHWQAGQGETGPSCFGANQSRVDLSGFGGKTNGYQNPVAYQCKSILFNLGISMALPVKYGGFNPYQWLAVIMGRTSLINGQTRIETIETLSAESLFVHLWCMSPTDDAPAEKGKTRSNTILKTEWVWCAILERYLCIWITFARRWQRNCFLLVVIFWTCLWLFNTTNHRW